MIPSTPQHYTEVMAQMASRTPPAPTPQQVRNQPVNIPGVFNQTNNLFHPVVSDINKDNK